MPDTITMLMVALGILLVIIVAILAIHFNQQQKKKQEFAIFTGKSSGHKSKSLRVVYDILTNFFITRRLMRRIRNSYEFLFPGDELKIVRSSMRVVEVLGAVIAGAVVFLVTQSFSFFGNCVFLLTMYFTLNEVLELLLRGKNVSLLYELDRFITDVRHFYFEHGMVDEAVEQSIQEAGPLMRLHGQKIYDVITSADSEGEVIAYNESIPNRFLRTFLANCTMVIKFGDSKPDGESLFLRNLRDLKREISIEKRKQEKEGFLFNGLTFLCIVPLYAMPFCKNWCINNLPSLEKFYEGSIGVFAQIAIFACSVISYNLIRKLKDDGDAYKSDHPVLDFLYNFRFIAALLDSITASNYGKTLRLKNVLRRSGAGISVEKFYLKRIISAILTGVLCCFLLVYGHELDKRNFLKVVTVDEKASAAFINADYAMIEPTALEFINTYVKSNLSLEELKERVADAGVFRYIDASDFTAELIYKQIQSYHNEYFKWYELLVALAVGVIGYFIPLFLLRSKEKALAMQMDDEVIQFQSVILMLVHLPNVTVETILEWMCDFAVIFKPSIQECIDNFSYGNRDALEKLLEDEPFPAFERIVKNLISCEDIGVVAAFNEISVDRDNYQEARKQENEIAFEKKSGSATLYAMATFMAVLILYLIGPFIYGAFSVFSDASGLFNF